MSDVGLRLRLTSEQLLAERVHVGLRSPVVLRTIRTQRLAFLVLGGVLVALGLLLLALEPLGPDGSTSEPGTDPVLGGAVVLIGVLAAGFAIALPAYYRYATAALERKAWAYLGDDGAVVELSPAGLAFDAPGRSARTGWAYYDDVASLPTGLELRRRGGPVAFYVAEAFGSAQELESAGAHVRHWIATAQR